MVVVMSPDATDEQVDAVRSAAQAAGSETFTTRGAGRILIGPVGSEEKTHALGIRQMPGVTDVFRATSQFHLTGRHQGMERSTVAVGHSEVAIGPDTFTLMAGPCAVESYGQMLEAAEMAQAAGASLLRGGAFKPLTSPDQFPGLGEEALKILADVRDVTGLPFVTEVIDPTDLPAVAAYADMIQVGARNMTNTELLDRVSQTGKPVLLKRGAEATIEEWLLAAESLARRGHLDIVLCERGIRTFEPSTHTTLDLSAVPIVQELSHLPVIVDPTHATGRRELVLPLARAAIAIGSDGILVDIHPDPESALCDGSQALAGADVRELASAVRRIPPVIGRESRAGQEHAPIPGPAHA